LENETKRIDLDIFDKCCGVCVYCSALVYATRGDMLRIRTTDDNAPGCNRYPPAMVVPNELAQRPRVKLCWVCGEFVMVDQCDVDNAYAESFIEETTETETTE